jgi:selenocysteine lyase/cysteine desulfurase
MWGEPEYRGGGTITAVTPTTVDWAAAPDSEEAGSPNVVGAIALARAAKILEQIGLPAIAGHEAALTRYALTRLKEVPDLVVYGETEPSYTADRSGVIPFTVGTAPSQLVAAILGFEWGIGVRSGCFCAQPYVMSLLGIGRQAQHRMRYNLLHKRRDLAAGMVRVSFGLYNTRQEIDVLIQALTAIAAGQYGDYTVDKATGHYTPTGSVPDISAYFKI